MAWLLRPRHIPKQPIGNRRRKGHFSSLGRRISSYSCTKEQSFIRSSKGSKVSFGRNICNDRVMVSPCKGMIMFVVEIQLSLLYRWQSRVLLTNGGLGSEHTEVCFLSF